MHRQFSSVSRRWFLQSTALGAAATGLLSAPAVLRAQGPTVKIGDTAFHRCTIDSAWDAILQELDAASLA